MFEEFKVRGDFYGSSDTATTTFDSWVKDYGRRKRRNDRHNVDDENRRTTRQIDNVDEQTSGSDSLGDIRESNEDFTAE